MDLNDLLKNIPPGMENEEVLRNMRDRMASAAKEDKTGPFTPAATIAVNLIRYAATDCVDSIKRLNQELGTDFPVGDAVIMAGLATAALAFSELLADDLDHGARRSISTLALVIKPQVMETVKSLLMKSNGSNVVDHSAGFAARFNLGGKDDKR